MTKIANHNFNCGRYRAERTDDVSSQGANAITMIAPNIANTPKNFASMMPPVIKDANCTTQTSDVNARKIA